MISLSNVISIIKTVLDIGLVWLAIYLLIRAMKSNDRLLQLFKGVMSILVIKLFTTLLNLSTANYIVDQVINYGVLAIIIIFTPEIRSVLEKIGSTSLRMDTLSENEIDNLLSEIVETVDYLSKNKVGALITFEKHQQLNEYINLGKYIDSEFKKDLLLTIFYEGTPLHDGAVIVRGNRVLAAACFYPSTTQSLPTQFGARHRAAIGISEITDALTIVVSEETGHISYSSEGTLHQIELSDLRAVLIKEIDYFRGVK